MKKIIALATAAFFILSFFVTNFVTYAAEDYTLSDYIKDTLSATEKLITGEYTIDEFCEYTTSAGVKFGETGLNKVEPFVDKITSIYNKYGSAYLADVVKFALSGPLSDYQVTETVSTTDIQGGVCAIEYWTSGRSFHRWYSSKESGRIVTYSDGRIEYHLNSYFYWWIADINGNYTRAPTYENGGALVINPSDGYIDFKLYGDWQYHDGTPAETNDEYVTQTKYDFTQKQDPNNPDNMIPTTELELNKLLDDILAALENASPDLSSIESTLNAIYYKLGQLDSDNDNELLSEVLTAIKVIEGSSSAGDNTELLETLKAIKKSLVYENGENSETLADKLNQIIKNQITSEDFKIDEELRNNNGEILKLRLLGKFSFINTLKEFVTHIFDTYSQSSEIPEFSIEIYGEECKINMDIFNDNLPFIQAILAAFIYISYGYHTYRKIPSYINGGDNE